jgi:DNA-binding response OmpR family regulator
VLDALRVLRGEWTCAVLDTAEAVRTASIRSDITDMVNKKILLVDDDKDLLRGMSVSLRASGYEVFNAQDAVTAVSVARSSQPDLIVLDIGLPGGDGFVVMERLSYLPAFIPIIVVSARESAPNRERALKAGAAAFFQKPIDRTAFMVSVREALKQPPQ